MLGTLVLCLLLSQAQAARMLLRVKAVNPIESSQVVSIRSNLPRGISTNDVLSLDGLDLGYDVKNDVYYVYKDVRLGPKAVEVFDVEIDDIWVIDESDLNALAVQARNLAGKLAGTEFAATGSDLRQRIESTIAQIRTVQNDNAIRPGVPPLRHITAYEENEDRMQRAKRDIGHLENLVLETGQDPGTLVGEDRRAVRLRREVELPNDAYGTALMRITVENTSPSETRQVAVVRSELPPEIQADDVVNPGQMSVGVDAETGTAYVYREDVTIPPGEFVEFTVSVRDKWNINEPRVRQLQGSVSNLLERIGSKEKFPSIERQLTLIQNRLEGIMEEEGPATLNPEYVAFYRNQGQRVDELEVEINRIQAALKPIEKTKPYGFDVQAPSMKTTWLIIYIILGFLAFVSLLFFLRWYGKTRDERMWEQLSGEPRKKS